MARRVIAHADIDAFYASVELKKHPDLAGRPLVVAGTGPRSVVTTASYEARRFGVDSAMPAARARALCPQAVFLPPDFESYRATSRAVWDLVRSRIARVQQVGIDEAYLDVTDVEPKPLRVLHDLVEAVREQTGMHLSIGVGPSRLVAKTVSGAFKPRAFVALSREDACFRFAERSTRVLQGIGPKTAERLEAAGFRTVGDLQRADEAALAERFGTRSARELVRLAHFHDDSEVAPPGPAKSRSSETTFNEDVADLAELERVLVRQAAELCEGCRAKDVAGRTVRIKVRLDDWTTVTRARTLDARTNDTELVTRVALELLRDYAPPRPVRLLGVGLAAFEEPEPRPAPAPRVPPGQLALAIEATPATSLSTSSSLV